MYQRLPIKVATAYRHIKVTDDRSGHKEGEGHGQETRRRELQK